jgi:hypothetical protein
MKRRKVWLTLLMGFIPVWKPVGSVTGLIQDIRGNLAMKGIFGPQSKAVWYAMLQEVLYQPRSYGSIPILGEGGPDSLEKPPSKGARIPERTCFALHATTLMLLKMALFFAPRHLNRSVLHAMATRLCGSF